MLQAYNCDRQKPGKKAEKMPAEKQLYRPDYVLHHFIIVTEELLATAGLRTHVPELLSTDHCNRPDNPADGICYPAAGHVDYVVNHSSMLGRWCHGACNGA